MPKPPAPVSQFAGVSWVKNERKWLAQLVHQGEKHFLGTFSDEEEAARAFDVAARRLRGDQAHGGGSSRGPKWRLNFPTPHEADGSVKAAKGRLSPRSVPSGSPAKQPNPPKSEYKCRVCGQPKKGHTCPGPPPTSGSPQPKPRKRPEEYKCKVCGLPKKGHTCGGVWLLGKPKAEPTRRPAGSPASAASSSYKCTVCGFPKKGHICSGIMGVKGREQAAVAFPRPRGKARKGHKWDYDAGKWVPVRLDPPRPPSQLLSAAKFSCNFLRRRNCK